MSSCLPILPSSARVRKQPLRDVALSHPLAVQFTPEQMAWLDSLRRGGLSRSAVLRLVVEDGMRQKRDAVAALR